MHITAFNVLGIEIGDTFLKAVHVLYRNKKIVIQKLFQEENLQNVKQLYIDKSPLLVSSLHASSVLTRQVTVPKTYSQDLLTTITFQIESLLPYPIDTAILQTLPLSEEKKKATYLALVAKKEAVVSHNLLFEKLETLPEVILAEQASLVSLSHYLKKDNVGISLFLNLGQRDTTLIAVKDGQLLASRTINFGLDYLVEKLAKDTQKARSEAQDYLLKIPITSRVLKSCQAFNAALLELKKEIEKIYFSIKQALIEIPLEITILGQVFQNESVCVIFQKEFAAKLNMPQAEGIDITTKDLLSYAVPLGSALSALPKSKIQVNFLSSELQKKHPLKRYKSLIRNYLLLGMLTSLIVYGIGISVNSSRKFTLTEKSYKLLREKEKAFSISLKNSSKSIEEMDLDEILAHLEEDPITSKYPYPLKLNTFKVIDVLEWLGKNIPQGIQVEKLSYKLEKYPSKKNPKDNYLARVEIEVKTDSLAATRDLQEKLIAPNSLYFHDKEFRFMKSEEGVKISFLLKPNP